MKISVDDPGLVAKRAFYLAWEACGGPFGMGALRDNAEATEDDVMANIAGRGDYDGLGPEMPEGRYYADYVFGRMMKLRIGVDDGHVEVDDFEPRIDYQGWCGRYPTNASLISAAVESLAEAASHE